MSKYKNKYLIFGFVVVNLAIVLLGRFGNFTTSSGFDLFTSVLTTRNIVSLTNEARRDAKVSHLRISRKLNVAAQKKADDMLKNGYFAHQSPTGKMAWDFIDDAQYEYIFAGENLAINFITAETVTQAWIKSPSHRENILSPLYSDIGIGITRGEFAGVPVVIIVQIFAKPI